MFNCCKNKKISTSRGILLILGFLLFLSLLSAVLCPDARNAWLDKFVKRETKENKLLPLNGEDVSANIKVLSPQPGNIVSSPLIIKGAARGGWFFEASFPIKIINDEGIAIATTIAQAQTDWMTNDFVPFEATVNFTIDNTQAGFLILAKDNPSGLPANAAEFKIPVILEKKQACRNY